MQYLDSLGESAHITPQTVSLPNFSAFVEVAIVLQLYYLN